MAHLLLNLGSESKPGPNTGGEVRGNRTASLVPVHAGLGRPMTVPTGEKASALLGLCHVLWVGAWCTGIVQ